MENKAKPSDNERTEDQDENKNTENKKVEERQRSVGVAKMPEQKVWITGPLGCKWKQKDADAKTTWWEISWTSLMLCIVVYSLTWVLFWGATSNNWDYILEFLFPHVGHFQWWLLFMVLSVLAGFYLVFLLVLFFLHICFRNQVYIHWLHKILIIITMIMCIIATIGFQLKWPDIWPLTHLFIQHHWIIIHPILLTFFLFMGISLAQSVFQGERIGLHLVGLTLYVIILVGLYTTPVLFKSPCVIEPSRLPPKPQLIAHRGGSALGPENTYFAFEKSVEYDTFGFEGDLMISYDGVPFLFHDSNLRRVTNVDDMFPDKAYEKPYNFNISQLRSLNAGSWYIKHDPFKSISYLNEEEKKKVSNQTIATAEEVFKLIKKSNKTFLFDLKFRSVEGHPYKDTATQMFVDLIYDVGINPRKVIWVYYTNMVNGTENFIKATEDLLTVEDMKRLGIELLNSGYRQTDYQLFRQYLENNIHINIFVINEPWLYSMFWCLGVNTTTTNEVRKLKNLDYPLLVMSPTLHLILWASFDAVSAILTVLIFIYTAYRRTRSRAADLPVGEDEFVWSVEKITRPQKIHPEETSSSGNFNMNFTMSDESHIPMSHIDKPH